MKILKFFKLSSLLYCSLCSSGVAMADSGGTMFRFMINGSPDFMFSTTGPRTNKPACSIAGDEWGFNAGTPAGKAMMAALIAAQATKSTVYIVGSGKCSEVGDREKPLYISVG